MPPDSYLFSRRQAVKVAKSRPHTVKVNTMLMRHYFAHDTRRHRAADIRECQKESAPRMQRRINTERPAFMLFLDSAGIYV